MRRFPRPGFSFLAPFALAACAAPPPSPAAPAHAPALSAAVTHDAAPPTPTAEDAVAKLQGAALASNGAVDVVRSLTSQVGNRIAGGPNDPRAVTWAEAALAAAGLSRVRKETVLVPRWERGKESVEIVGGAKLSALALGGSPGTKDAGIVGSVLEVASVGALEKLDANAVRGKVVFVNVRTERTRDGSGYGRAMGTRYSAPRVAGERGAVAVVIRSIGTDETAPHTGGTSRKAEIPTMALSSASADALSAALAGGKNVKVRVTSSAAMRAEVESANVLGDIVGASEPDEVVLLGAHLDSWDVGTGAVDDGAGCAIVLEAARLIAQLGQRPRRTVRVVLFAAEEIGMLGGAAYAKAHQSELAKHVVAMEADSGTAKVYGVRYLGGARSSFERIAQLLSPLGIAADGQHAHGGADLEAMRGAGVPVIDLEQDFSRYFDVHHTDNDTFEAIEPDGLRQAVAAYATVAWAVANGALGLDRIPETKREEP